MDLIVMVLLIWLVSLQLVLLLVVVDVFMLQVYVVFDLCLGFFDGECVCDWMCQYVVQMCCFWYVVLLVYGLCVSWDSQGCIVVVESECLFLIGGLGCELMVEL